VRPVMLEESPAYLSRNCPTSPQDIPDLAVKVAHLCQAFECVAFDDLFLRDIRDYRERQLKGSGLTPIFSVWDMPTRELTECMIESFMNSLGQRLTSRVSWGEVSK
jgi:hypothetical protein